MAAIRAQSTAFFGGQMSTLRFEQNGKTGFITLTDPPDNKIGSAFNKEFREALHQVAVSDVRALVIRSEGENFCNGADVLEFAKLEPKIFRTLVNEVHSSFRLLESLRMPTIASVQGMAVGGGFELALACDFLVVEASATLFSVEVLGGMLPGAGGIQRIADRIGHARTIRMMMLAEPISGEQAAALGIATHVVSSGELQKATTDLALKLSTGPTRAYAAIKGLMKAWSPGVAAADLLLSDLSADLYENKEAWKKATDLALKLSEESASRGKT
jgi:enoyl-CoA hydratase/carnithine racemase